MQMVLLVDGIYDGAKLLLRVLGEGVVDPLKKSAKLA